MIIYQYNRFNYLLSHLLVLLIYPAVSYVSFMLVVLLLSSLLALPYPISATSVPSFPHFFITVLRLILLFYAFLIIFELLPLFLPFFHTFIMYLAYITIHFILLLCWPPLI